MKKGVKYKKPPLIEALCELQFQKTGMVPNIILGKIYEQIEEEFPTVETYKGIEVKPDEEKLSQSIVVEERTRFVSKDKTRLIQVGAGLLIANQLKPYIDYSSFRTFVKGVVDTYYKVAKPEELQSIGMRYINRVEIKSDQSLDDVFNIGFTIPDTFQSFPDPFLLRTEFAYPEGQDKLIVILATSQTQDNSTKAIMLDFDYRLVEPKGVDENLLEWLDKAHEKIEDAFHACLKESVLASFDIENT
ncbi:MAG: hypothetical protein QG641_885 [Candidatus Poribacteria bacterium]|nr:hypothetical protein [Candidatus Poribacteria bacterium]